MFHFDIEPHNELLHSETPEIRLALSPENATVVMYIPFNIEVNVKIDLKNYETVKQFSVNKAMK